jgi:hypothetical protein
MFERELAQALVLLKLNYLVMCPPVGVSSHEALQKMTTQAAQVNIDELGR